MASLRNLFGAILIFSLFGGLIITYTVSTKVANKVSEVYRKDCEHITFLAAKNLQYMLNMYFNDVIALQGIQNVYFHVDGTEAVFLSYQGKTYVYPKKEKRLITSFKKCYLGKSKKALVLPEGILVCYPLKEELATQLLGKPQVVGVFGILFSKGAYESMKKEWIYKLFYYLFLFNLFFLMGYFFVYLKMKEEFSLLQEFVNRVKVILNDSSLDLNLKKSLEELKKSAGKIHFKEFKIMANLILRLTSDFLSLKLRLQREAIEDPLTGLYNRNYLLKFSRALLSIAKRQRIPLSVAVIDIDDFKKVNDTYGHLKGDEVLRTLGEVIKGRIRVSDVPIRYGGEEIVIIFMNAEKREAASILEEIKEKFSSVDFGIGKRITFSGGIASYPKDLTDPISIEELIEIADERLYKAKKEGKNKIIWE